MKIHVLGASGAVFPGQRPPAFLVDDSLLLDAGTIGAVLDEQAQWKIRTILVTHAHLDHICSIPFLADNIILRDKKHSVSIMSIPAVLKTLKKNLLNDQIWPDFTRIPTVERAVLRLEPIKPRKPFSLGDYTVTAHNVSHSVPAVGYALTDRKGKRLIYTGDTGPTDAIWAAETQNGETDALIVEVSFPNRMAGMAELTGHLTAALLKQEIKKMRHTPQSILITHPKPQYRALIERELAALRMPMVRLLKTGETVEI